jgi:hypothetical protein
MKAYSLMIVIAGILSFNACSDDSLLVLETPTPATQMAPEQGVIHLPGDEKEAVDFGPDLTNLTADTTIVLQLSSSYHDVVADELTVHLAINYSFEIQALSANQLINFSTTGGDVKRLALLPVSFAETNELLSVVFDLDGKDLSGLDIQAVQSIIVEEVIMN